MLMKNKLMVVVAGAALTFATAVPVVAHHAFGAEFDANRPVLLKGKIVKVELVNPHAWIHVEVAKEGGGTEVWMVEGGTPNTLLRRGITKNTLAIGTEVVVDGYQSKDRSTRANGRDITFPDGKKLFMGSSGTGAPRDGKDASEPAPK
jgi:DNA/RNA endonuclease YhcR with UshA esterase domain